MFQCRQHIVVAVLCGLLLTGGCRQPDGDLLLADLTAGERSYFDHVIAVERAKAVALVSRDAGDALLDSLAAAWGDSIAPQLLVGLSGDPDRSAAVNQLLLRVLAAEQDSLQMDAGGYRLNLPLPDPDRRGRERPLDPDSAIPATER